MCDSNCVKCQNFYSKMIDSKYCITNDSFANIHAKIYVTCQTLYSLRPAEPHVQAYAQQNPTITLHRDLLQSSANARSHTLVVELSSCRPTFNFRLQLF